MAGASVVHRCHAGPMVSCRNLRSGPQRVGPLFPNVADGSDGGEAAAPFQEPEPAPVANLALGALGHLGDLGVLKPMNPQTLKVFWVHGTDHCGKLKT